MAFATFPFEKLTLALLDRNVENIRHPVWNAFAQKVVWILLCYSYFTASTKEIEWNVLFVLTNFGDNGVITEDVATNASPTKEYFYFLLL